MQVRYTFNFVQRRCHRLQNEIHWLRIHIGVSYLESRSCDSGSAWILNHIERDLSVLGANPSCFWGCKVSNRCIGNAVLDQYRQLLDPKDTDLCGSCIRSSSTALDRMPQKNIQTVHAVTGDAQLCPRGFKPRYVQPEPVGKSSIWPLGQIDV